MAVRNRSGRVRAAVGVLVLVAAVGLAAAPARAKTLGDAFAAYERCDYAAALLIGRPLAEQGTTGAQLLVVLRRGFSPDPHRQKCTAIAAKSAPKRQTTAFTVAVA